MYQTSAWEFEWLHFNDLFMDPHFTSFTYDTKTKCPYSKPKINFYLSLFPWSS